MVVGFKTGPRSWEEGKKIVLEDKPPLCEVWFRIDQVEKYKEIFSFLQEHNVQIGLHHWGVVEGKYKTNLATNNEEIRHETIQQIKHTIDICAEIQGVYVNAHPGAAQVEELNLESGAQRPVDGHITEAEESGALFLAAAEELEVHAQQRNIALTLETLIAQETYTAEDRNQVYNPQPVPLAVMGKLGTQGNWLANDITHTLAALAVWETNEERCWELFMQFTQATAPFTRLLHVNTLTPPYNGTDSHDGILAADFARGVRPTRAQLIEAFRLFAKRDDIFVIPEPNSDMQGNWRALQELVQSI